MQDLVSIIEHAFDKREEIKIQESPEVRNAVSQAINLLDKGAVRVAEPQNGKWVVNQGLKKAVLLSFLFSENQVIDGGWTRYFDKVPRKFDSYNQEDFEDSRIRVVPPAMVRKGAYIAPNAVLMPSYVNIGAWVGENTMVDTWATVGSCAQIGKDCHISGGAGIGGVLEPLQAEPVIIEDNCFIGARSEVAEGVVIEEGAVLSMGVFIGASTKIVKRATGEVTYGRVPAYSVVVPGSMPSEGGVSLYCAVIVKQVDEGTRSKTSINELLRD